MATYLFLWLSLGTVAFWEPSAFDFLFVPWFVFVFVIQHRGVRSHLLGIATLLSMGVIGSLFGAMQNGILKDALPHSLVTLYLIGLFLLCAAIAGRDRDVMLHCYVAAGCVAAVTGLLQLAGVVPALETRYAPRIAGLFKDPNVFGALLASCVLLAIGLSMSAHMRRQRLSWLAAAVVCSIGLTFSYSRGAFVSAAAGLLWFLLLLVLQRGNVARTALRGLLLAVLLATSAGYFLLTRTDSFTFFQERTELQSYDSDRFERHEAAINHLLSSRYDLFGEGFSYTQNGLAGQVHNTWLQVLVEGGIVSFVVFGTLVFYALGRSTLAVYEAEPRDKFVAAALSATIAGLVLSFFVIDTLHWRHLWILVGIVLGADRSRRQSHRAATA